MMPDFINQFNSLYPVYKTISYNQQDCQIQEPNVKNNGKDFLSLTIESFSGELFPFELASKSTSFYEKAGSRDPMKSNCDGMLYMKECNRNILLMCELKSGFDVDRISEAKEQIVGSYMRLSAQLSIVQSRDNCEIHGLIVSYAPSTQKLTGIKTLTDRKAKFVKKLYIDKSYKMEGDKCKQFYSPLNVPGIHLHYVGVPEGTQHYTITSQDLLQLLSN